MKQLSVSLKRRGVDIYTVGILESGIQNAAQFTLDRDWILKLTRTFKA